MNVTIQRASALQGALTVPPDKSVCHRAVLLAALAKGATEIRPWPAADDCQRTLELVRQLGAAVQAGPDGVRIEGSGGPLRAPSQELFCGESGTTLRLAAGVLAGQPFASRLTAGPGLSLRPMRRIAEPLSRMGAVFNGGSTAEELHPPLAIEGRRPLRAIRYELPVASAQVKSAILLAGLFADGPTTVIERVPTRDHTERMLRRFGASVRVQGGEVSVEPGALTAPGLLELPGDASSAAFFIAAAACAPGSSLKLMGVSLNPTRIAFFHVLERMGAEIRWAAAGEAWEPRGTVTVAARPLRAVTLSPEEVPGLIDELPALMVAAACASGTSRLAGVGELRVKETDRIRSMADGLTRLGAAVRVIPPDTLEIDGGPLRGAEVESAGDHRTAMSLAVAGLLARGDTVIRGAECVAKSFPDFFDQLRRVGGSSTVKTVDKP